MLMCVWLVCSMVFLIEIIGVVVMNFSMSSVDMVVLSMRVIVELIGMKMSEIMGLVMVMVISSQRLGVSCLWQWGCVFVVGFCISFMG